MSETKKSGVDMEEDETLSNDENIDEDEISEEDENLSAQEAIESKLESGEDLNTSSSDISMLIKSRVIYSCPRCRRIFFRNKWIPDKVTDIYTVRTELAYCDKCLGKEVSHFIGCIECHDLELKSKQKALINLSKRVEAELENRLPFEKVIATLKENDIFYIFLNSTRLTIEIAREIRKEFQGSMQYEWYERNQFVRAKWFAQKEAREEFKENIKLSKYKRLGVFTFEQD